MPVVFCSSEELGEPGCNWLLGCDEDSMELVGLKFSGWVVLWTSLAGRSTFTFVSICSRPPTSRPPLLPLYVVEGWQKLLHFLFWMDAIGSTTTGPLRSIFLILSGEGIIPLIEGGPCWGHLQSGTGMRVPEGSDVRLRNLRGGQSVVGVEGRCFCPEFVDNKLHYFVVYMERDVEDEKVLELLSSYSQLAPLECLRVMFCSSSDNRLWQESLLTNWAPHQEKMHLSGGRACCGYGIRGLGPEERSVLAILIGSARGNM